MKVQSRTLALLRVTASMSAVMIAGGCARTAPPGSAPMPASAAAAAHPDDVRAMLSVLVADSMEGRMTGSRGSAKAAAWIADQMRAAGLTPVGDSGFFQRVPLAAARDANGRERLVLLPSLADRDTVPAERRRPAVNVVGMIRGSDPVLRDQVVLIDAHYDHLGIGRPVNGDSIFNGADDDGSGTVAVLAIARAIASGPPPKRTLIFAATTGEEVGLLGTRWYIAHPEAPLEQMVANLEIEMIARPDSLAGGPGKAWLTGYDRSTMGDMLRAAGIPIVADPRPDQRFFERSDNVAFARRGIPAHTLSTFNLHADYHRVTDDVSRVDFDHMARVIDAATRAVRILADGTAPRWKPGGQPTQPAPRTRPAR